MKSSAPNSATSLPTNSTCPASAKSRTAPAGRRSIGSDWRADRSRRRSRQARPRRRWCRSRRSYRHPACRPEDEVVGPAEARHYVVIGAALDRVRRIPADNGVVAGVPEQDVGCVVLEFLVRHGPDQIVASAAEDHVRRDVAAAQKVVAAAAEARSPSGSFQMTLSSPSPHRRYRCQPCRRHCPCRGRLAPYRCPCRIEGVGPSPPSRKSSPPLPVMVSCRACRATHRPARCR